MSAIRRRFAMVLLMAAALAATPALGASLLGGLFQDHAVLQRDKPIRIWGQAKPDAEVSVALAKETAQATADSDGKWSATLDALPAGGPYTLTATAAGGESQTIHDVMVGDVWLCGGQSNMVLPVKAAIDSFADIANAANNSIRLLTVANDTSPKPLDELVSPVKWLVASPKTVPDFSATCYFFGRDLQKSVDVPTGLIMSAWDGANITTFMSDEALRKAGGYDLRLDALKLYAADPKTGMAHWGKELEAWWRAHLPGHAEPWNENAGNWAVAPAGLGVWSLWGVPALKQPGQVWFRTTVTLTPQQATQEAGLTLGEINEEDQTWVNGGFIGNTFGFNAVRHYTLPAGTLHAGKNNITVEVLCTWRNCGIFGPGKDRELHLKDGTTLPLDGTWRYWITPKSVAQAPRAPWGAVPGVSMAYNAMIAPLERYGFKGALWYQGESNTGAPKQYRTLLSNLMTDWRAKFGGDLPFLVVQLPDFGLQPIKPPMKSDWAELRESQRAAVAADPDAALAVTIDIGSHYGLHPAQKQEVGRRLALAARRLVFKQSGVATSPVAVAAWRHARSVIVKFKDVDKGLVAYNANEPIGFELCTAKECRFARGRILGDAVWLQVPAKFPATQVRYCWADGPVCTLFDGARLPAGPFALPILAEPHGKAAKH